MLDNAIAVLSALEKSDFADSGSNVQPYSSYKSDFSPYFDLPSATVPPEAMELEALADGAEESAPTIKNDEWPEYRLRLFPDDVCLNRISLCILLMAYIQVTADDTTVLGYVVRTLLSDVIDIFEVNRKECSRLLLDIPKWLPQGTFKARPGVPSENEDAKGPSWQLESCIMEVCCSNSI